MQPSMGTSLLHQTKRQACSKGARAQNRKGLFYFNSQHVLIFLL